MRNGLERFAAEALTKEGLQFEYEKSYELFPSFAVKLTAIERIGKSKVLKLKKQSYQNIVFTPDFIGDG
jgi:hypothetical protein